MPRGDVKVHPVIRRVGGLEVMERIGKLEEAVIRRVGGLEALRPFRHALA